MKKISFDEMSPNYRSQALGGDKITTTSANSIPLYLVTTEELKHGGSWKLTISVVLLLTLKRTTDGASGAPEQEQKNDIISSRPLFC